MDENKWFAVICFTFIGWALMFIILTSILNPIPPIPLFWQQMIRLSGVVGAILFLLFIIGGNKKIGRRPVNPIDVIAALLSCVTGPVILFTTITLYIITWKMEKKST